MKPGEIAHSVTRGAFYLALEKAAALLSGIAYFALLSAGPEANTRFRFPASPFLAILAGHGLSQVIGRLRAG